MLKILRNKIICIVLQGIFFLHTLDSQQVIPGVRIYSGAINGVFIERNGKTLVVYGDPENKKPKAEMVLFTHFRRDVIWAGRALVRRGSLAVAPAKEKPLFTSGDSIWTEFAESRFHDYKNQSTKIGFEPLEIYRFSYGDETLRWQDLEIRVLNTPGYTRGSVSYLLDIDKKRIAFTGDLIYGDGKIFDLYSFQDTLGDIMGYHGYAVRIGQLISSLKTIANQKPDLIIPVRGPIIKDPDTSIKKLIQRLSSLYQNYLSITAFRWYSVDRSNLMASHVLGRDFKVDWMSFSSVIQKNPHTWYRHFGNTNMVFADDGSAFLIDCGTTGALDQILKLKNSGQLKHLDGIFLTHYHDDHTDLINNVLSEFNTSVFVTEELKDILENPSAYRMPCLTKNPITNLKIVKNGQKISWKDFTLTFYFFPGQTIYHDAVLFEKSNGEAIFFIGDSFTPSGIDDYCLLNRNLLHPGTGYFYCLELLKKLPENVLLANQHVAPLFAFSRQQLDFMTTALLKRDEILKDLFPWDDINYGLDEQWIKFYPYGQKTSSGQTIDFSVKIFNHSDKAKTFIIELNVPDGFKVEPKTASLVINPLIEGEAAFKMKIADHVSSGVSLITANVKFDNWDLREWCEALVEISP